MQLLLLQTPTSCSCSLQGTWRWIATDRFEKLQWNMETLCLSLQSKAIMWVLWLLKHANLAEKGLWLGRRPSKHLQRSSSFAALAVGRPPAFHMPPQHSTDVQQLKAEVLLSSHACHVLSVQEKCSIRAPCLSSPGFHHLLQQRAYEEGESLLPQSLYFSNSHWKILATTVVLVVKHKSGHTFMWCGWISKVATPNRRSAPAACHLHNCHWYLEIDEYTCAPSTKIKDKKNWGAHRGAKGTFGGKLAVGLKHLHAQSDETSFTTWLTWQ